MSPRDKRTAFIVLETGIRVGPGRLAEENDTYLYMELLSTDSGQSARELQIPISRILYIEYAVAKRESFDWDEHESER